MNGNGNGVIKINLEKLVKERLEEIAERGKVGNQAEQILISTATLIYQVLSTRSDQIDREIKDRIEEKRKEVGLFFPLITEAIFDWREEGREDIPKKIKELAKEINDE